MTMPTTPSRLSIKTAVLAAAAALLLAPTVASAQDRLVPPSRDALQYSYSPIVKKAAPAVVNVYVRSRVRTAVSPFANDPFFQRFFGGRGGFGLPQERIQSSLGSGVIISSDGVIVTNTHVVKGGTDTQIRVALSDKREYDARIVTQDERTDLAVLKIEKGGNDFPFLQFADSDKLEVGDVVLAIGNPFGVGQTVTHGIISALARTQVGITDYQFFIQTDAAINPGNSGGALVDLSGKLVGINTAIFSRSGGSQGVGFAIPSNMVRVVAASARNRGGAVRRPWLGARLQPLTPEIAESLGLKRPFGALVANVAPESPAAKAGLKVGDVIVSVEGQQVDDPNAFDYRFATRPLGGTAKIAVLRDGRELTVTVALQTAPETPRDEIIIRSRSPFSGMKVANLSHALAEELQRERRAEGVVVLDTDNGSYASNLGFQRGDIIEEVNGERIAKTRDLERAAKGQSRSGVIVITGRGNRISAMFN